jgi:hypothetical protein
MMDVLNEGVAGVRQHAHAARHTEPHELSKEIAQKHLGGKGAFNVFGLLPFSALHTQQAFDRPAVKVYQDQLVYLLRCKVFKKY